MPYSSGWFSTAYYRPQRSCGQGNVFTGVCLSTGGGCLPQCMLGCHTPPPGPGRPPRDQADTPPDQGDPPGPGRPPRDQADTPLGQGRHPPRDQADTCPGPGRHPPPGKQTPAYGLRAAGTHPTGMHSCLINVFSCKSKTHSKYKGSIKEYIVVLSLVVFYPLPNWIQFAYNQTPSFELSFFIAVDMDRNMFPGANILSTLKYNR